MGGLVVDAEAQAHRVADLCDVPGAVAVVPDEQAHRVQGPGLAGRLVGDQSQSTAANIAKPKKRAPIASPGASEEVVGVVPEEPT